MSPERARVFVIDDDQEIRKGLRLSLQLRGHQIVGEAVAEREAMRAIDQFGSLRVQVVLLDNNLGPGGKGAGLRILPKIRQTCPEVKIIGFSTDYISGVDVDVAKDGSPRDLLRAIAEI